MGTAKTDHTGQTPWLSESLLGAHTTLLVISLWNSGPEVIKLFSCSTQLSMKFFLLINIKMPTIVVILTFMSGKNSILCLSEPI